MPVEALDEQPVEPVVEGPTLPGVVKKTPGGNIAFHSEQRVSRSLPAITSVWSDEITARAQKVADERGVPLEQIVREWEAVWAANG